MLRLEHVHVERGGRAVLRDVSFELAASEVLGLLGPSGAGKSTVFRYLAGTLAGSGRALLDGHDLSALPLWQRARLGLGVMPQEPSVLFDLSVRDNLQVFAELAGTTLPSPEERAREVDLHERLDVRARDLSAGERRRLEFLRAISHAPKVLLCDEPFAGVDPKGAQKLAEHLRTLAARGTAVLLADHHVEEALAICSRALLLLDGAIAAHADSAEAFRTHPLVVGRYLGTLHPA